MDNTLKSIFSPLVFSRAGRAHGQAINGMEWEKYLTTSYFPGSVSVMACLLSSTQRTPLRSSWFPLHAHVQSLRIFWD